MSTNDAAPTSASETLTAAPQASSMRAEELPISTLETLLGPGFFNTELPLGPLPPAPTGALRYPRQPTVTALPLSRPTPRSTTDYPIPSTSSSTLDSSAYPNFSSTPVSIATVGPEPHETVRRMTMLLDRIGRMRAALGLPPLLPGSQLGTPAYDLHKAELGLDGLQAAEAAWLKDEKNVQLMRRGMQLDAEAARRFTLAFASFSTALEPRENMPEPPQDLPKLECIVPTALQIERKGTYDPLIDWIPYPGLRDKLVSLDGSGSIRVDDVFFFMLQNQYLHGEPWKTSRWQLGIEFIRIFPQLIDSATLDGANAWRTSQGHPALTAEMLEKWRIENSSGMHGSGKGPSGY